MAGGKRASMREGPLADLFRRTDRRDEPGDEPDAVDARAARPSVEAIPAESFEAPVERAPAPAEPPGVRREPPVEPPRAAERLPIEPLRSRRVDVYERRPEPSQLRGATDRLREVFSSDIPDDVLERPRGDERYDASVRAPERARFGREEPKLTSTPAPVLAPILRVVGVGGAGVNAVDRMIEAQIAGVEFIAVNTDVQSLQGTSAHQAIHIGSDLTRGLGSGSDPRLGERAALEDYDRVKAAVKGSDMVFIAAGEGGGTGTGAAPVVARIAREVGALTVGIVTKPFGFEGMRRSDQADRGVEALAAEVDTVIVIPNSRLLTVLDRQTSMVDAFRMADDVLRQGVQGISDLITLPGLINLDFADVRTIMAEAGPALLGIGMGSGEQRAMDAAARAIASPLLDTSVEGARSILLSITGGRDLSLWEVNEAARAVSEVAHPDSNIIFGAMVDEKLHDEVWITVVATGYGDRSEPRRDERDSHSGVAANGAAARDRGMRDAARAADREPRVSRPPRRSDDLADFEVPEFIPRS